MERHSARTVAEYLAIQPPERRKVLASLRSFIKKHLPPGYQETLLYGMICYVVPLRVIPDTYNGQPLSYVALAAQKNYFSLYLTGVYANETLRKKLEDGYKKSGKKLSIGKGCVRFTDLDQLDLPTLQRVIAGATLKQFVRVYQQLHPPKGNSR